MSDTRAVHDPFLGKTVEVSNRLVDRLRGKYASGPTLPNGEPEFGWRQFETPPIQHEAADAIEALVKVIDDNLKRYQDIDRSEHGLTELGHHAWATVRVIREEIGHALNSRVGRMPESR